MFARLWLKALIVAAFVLTSGAARAELNEIKITKQPGLLFTPMLLMEQHKLVEKHASLIGLPELKVAWVTIMSGGANNDALLSGSVQITTAAATTIWRRGARPNANAKAFLAAAGLPFSPSTHNPI